MTPDLFDDVSDPLPAEQPMAEGAVLLRGFACGIDSALIVALAEIEQQAPFRRMVTPGGHLMSVAMTNCGSLGWVTDRRGYRYDPSDPETGRPWPAMPPAFRALAEQRPIAPALPDFHPTPV